MANGVETTAGKPDPREQFEIAAEGLSRAEIESRAYHRTLDKTCTRMDRANYTRQYSSAHY
jgi:hypothetical protein